MTADDIGFAIAMTDSEDWGNLPSDFERLIRLEPSGCFVAREHDNKVGMITTTSSTDYAFIGSLIVKDDYRRRGIGTRLMQAALAYLQNKNVETIELDATFEGVPLYRKLGFKDKYMSFRMRREAGSGIVGDIEQPPFHIEEILELDKRITGLDRRRLLRIFIDSFRQSVYTIQESRLKGYAVVYPRQDDLLSIGPIVAESVNLAEALVARIIDDYGGYDLAIGIPETAASMTDILLRQGFEYRAPSLRMYSGEKRSYEAAIFAIVSPEKG
jgi:GNAT superfamily N-acetyltransferase